MLRAVRELARVGGTGSRLLSGQTEGWRKLEEEFARFAGTEAALFFSSGYAANVGLLSSLVGKDDVVYSDVLNHASLIDGMRLSGARKVIYPHLDLSALEDCAAAGRRRAMAENHRNGKRIQHGWRCCSVAGDGSSGGEVWRGDDCGRSACDGRAGRKGGRGLAAEAGIVPQVLATIHTCGKALGSAGAFVCGPAVIEGAPDQPRADIYFQHGAAAIFCASKLARR